MTDNGKSTLRMFLDLALVFVLIGAGWMWLRPLGLNIFIGVASVALGLIFLYRKDNDYD
jgi:hypothetical protein